MEDSKRSSRMDNLNRRAEGRRFPPKEKKQLIGMEKTDMATPPRVKQVS